MKKKTLKLYVWEGALSDRTAGIMFALATSAQEAREIIFEIGDKRNFDKMKSGNQFSSYVWDELKPEPAEYEAKIGFLCFGGE